MANAQAAQEKGDSDLMKYCPPDRPLTLRPKKALTPYLIFANE